MNVIHRQHLPPSGVEFACQASLTPSTLSRYSDVIAPPEGRPRPITNLIVARSTFVHVFELCVFSSIETAGASDKPPRRKADYSLVHVCEHRLHGRVTGIQRLTTLDTHDDGLDRLLVSFQDAKMTLLEWSNSAADLVPVSLHTFEKLPQITQGHLPRDFQAQLEVDPLSRCAVLLLPQATLAVLPFFQDQLDLDGLGLNGGLSSALGSEQQRFQTFPYSSSFILDLNQQILNHLGSVIENNQRPIKSVIAIKFLPGFSEPTLAILYQTQYTWSARLENANDTTALTVLTLDLGSNHFPIISQTKSLPYDAHGLVACPKELAGVLVLCADMILHVDQSGKIIGVATNGWVKHTSELQVPRQETVKLITPISSLPRPSINSSELREDLEDGEEQDETSLPEGHEKLLIRLENSKIVFYKLDLALLFLRDGQVFSLQFARDGRTLTKLTLEKFDVRSIIPSTVIRMNDECLFVGSMCGDSALYVIDEIHYQSQADRPRDETTQSKPGKRNLSLDIDEDIYGEPLGFQSPNLNDNSELYNSTQSRGDFDDGRVGLLEFSRPSLRLSDAIRAHGPIRDFTMAVTGEENMQLELLACTGAGDLGGLTVFHREMPLRKRRRLRFNGSEPISGIFFTSLQTDDDRMSEEKQLIWIVRSGRHTEVASYGSSDQLLTVHTLPGNTLAVSSFFEARFIVQVTNTHLRLFTSSMEEVQAIQPESGAKIKRAHVVDNYLMLETYCGLKLIYQGDSESKTLGKLPFPPDTPEIQNACFLKVNLPVYNFKQTLRNQCVTKKDNMNDVEHHLYGEDPQNNVNGDVEMKDPHSPEEVPTTTLHDCTEACWLICTTKDGSFHIRSLPTLSLSFTATRLDTLPETLSDEDQMDTGAEPVELFGSVDLPSPTMAIAHVFTFLTGASVPRPHLAVMLQNGAFAVYELITSFALTMRSPEKEGRPAILLKKVVSRQLEAVDDNVNIPAPSGSNENEKSNDNLDEPFDAICWNFTQIGMKDKFKGVFLSSNPPLWLLSTDHGPCRIYDSPEGKTVKGIAQTSSGFLMCLADSASKDLDPSACSDSLWETVVPESVCFDREIPSTLVKTGRPFNKVVYDSFLQTIVGASYLETAFANFDEEGNLMWEPDDESLIRATTFRSSLELILPGKWVTIDGYEFQQNEWVTSLVNVDLDSRSTISGKRQFIGVGTTCNRAEDLAARGGVYVFEVIQVNPSEKHREYNRALRLRYYEETKACVTAVNALNGYFLHTMGQKLYAKCFEQDERLLAVGFLDIKPYATRLRVFKNLILLGDAVKGIMLVAFQEEPYKLIELGHTYTDLKCSTVDFLVIDSKLALVATDLYGIIRIFEYNPTNIESQGGQKLLCRTEFNTSSEMSCSMQFGKRISPKDEAKVMGTLFASLDGSIGSIVPAKDAVYKRLQLVQTRLTRHVQHFAGLNPKGHRTVRNDMVSRRSLWHHYYKNCDAVIFVVDTADRTRLAEAAEELHRAVDHDELRDASVLVFANKQDMPNAMSTSEVIEKFGLRRLGGRKWFVQGCTANTGRGLWEGLDWLAANLPPARKERA